MASVIDVAEVLMGEQLLKQVASGRDLTAAGTTTAWLRRAAAQAQQLRALASLSRPRADPAAQRRRGLTWWASHRRCAWRGLCGSIRRGVDLTARHAPGGPCPSDGASRGKAQAAMALRPPASQTHTAVSCLLRVL